MKSALFLVLMISLSSWAHADDFPLELRMLQENRAKKIAEIDRAYQKQLEALKLKYTKKGDLDSANQVDNVLKRMASKIDPTKVSTWKWKSGGKLSLRPDGVAEHTSWKRKGWWSIREDGSIDMESGAGHRFRITFKNGVGHVVGLEEGRRTTIVRDD